MAAIMADEVSPRIQEKLCLLPAALLVAERRSSFANRQHSFRLRKCVVNICEAAPVHFKSFIRKRSSKNLKLAELANSQRMGRSSSTCSGDSTVYDLSASMRRSKLLYYA